MMGCELFEMMKWQWFHQHREFRALAARITNFFLARIELVYDDDPDNISKLKDST